MISVIICTYNREKYIYDVLRSIAENTLSPPLYEVLVINNNSTDHTAAEIRRFQVDFPVVTLRIIHESRQGLSFARNRGIAEAHGELLIFVDDDATVNPEFLATYQTFFAQHPTLCCAGGKIVPHYEDGVEPSWMTSYTRALVTGALDLGNRGIPMRRHTPNGGNMGIRTTVFQSVGDFSPRLGRNKGNLLGGEEKDLFRRIRSAGYTLHYLPTAILYHSIPDYKLTEEYFRKVAFGVGLSERFRTLSISRLTYFRRLFVETVKWGGTFVLALRYLPSVGARKIRHLFRMRLEITRGLLYTGGNV